MNGIVSYIPKGYHTVTPYLIARNAEALLAFIQQVFDAREEVRMPLPDGGIMHAEVRIGDSVVMLAEATTDEMTQTAMLNLYLEDVDAIYQKAIRAGATSLRQPENQFYGDRSAGVKDAFGNQWWISTHIEDVSAEEMRRRFEAMAQEEA